MLKAKYIAEILDASRVKADEIQKILGVWWQDEKDRSLAGVFLKLDSGQYMYSIMQRNKALKRFLCPVSFYYTSQPSLASLDRSGTFYGTNRPWQTDSKALEAIRKTVYKMKKSSDASEKDFTSTPATSPIVSRTPSPPDAVNLKPLYNVGLSSGDIKFGPEFVDESNEAPQAVNPRVGKQ